MISRESPKDISPQHGKVKSHAKSISLRELVFSTPFFSDIPAPIIDALEVCVVLTGIPPSDAKSIQVAPAISDAKPVCRVSVTVSIPIFLIILYPPTLVPRAIIKEQSTVIHIGALESPKSDDALDVIQAAATKTPANF